MTESTALFQGLIRNADWALNSLTNEQPFDCEGFMDITDAELLLYRNAYQDGVDAARSHCDICPARAEAGQRALVSGCDLLLRHGIEN